MRRDAQVDRAMNNKFLKARLVSNKEAAEGQLDSGLRYLAQAVKDAREDLAKGRPLNAHLIHNAYNLSLDLLPYVEEKE